jgi:hypothetical protein
MHITGSFLVKKTFHSEQKYLLQLKYGHVPNLIKRQEMALHGCRFLPCWFDVNAFDTKALD